LKIEPYLKHTVINLAQPVFVQPLHKKKLEKNKNSNLQNKTSTHKPHTTTSKLLTHFTFLVCCRHVKGFSSSSSSFSHLALVSVILSSKI
jgi:hypothetical protein